VDEREQRGAAEDSDEASHGRRHSKVALAPPTKEVAPASPVRPLNTPSWVDELVLFGAR
jgi:hypothetical protein